jgi:hypothetical protein
MPVRRRISNKLKASARPPSVRIVVREYIVRGLIRAMSTEAGERWTPAAALSQTDMGQARTA